MGGYVTQKPSDCFYVKAVANSDVFLAWKMFKKKQGKSLHVTG